MQVPLWAIGTIVTVLVTIIGGLLKLLWSTTQKKQDAQDERLLALERGATATDKRFLEVELANTRAFVGVEAWSRDYVTLTQRVDGLHKRVDRIERPRAKSDAGDDKG